MHTTSITDLCGYVRHLLGVEKVIFNLTPVAQKLRLPEETLNQVVACWKSEAEQLKMVLQSSGFERQGNTEDHAMLRKALEGLEPEGMENPRSWSLTRAFRTKLGICKWLLIVL